MALQFVRLRTCHYLDDRSIGEFEEFEVLTQAEYAVQSEWNFIPDREEWSHPMARTVLAPKKFAALGFEPARVKAVEGGFRITRWTFHRTCYHWGSRDMDETYEYLKIEETVQTDGTYTRTLLRKYYKSDLELLHPTSGPNQSDPGEFLRPGNNRHNDL